MIMKRHEKTVCVCVRVCVRARAHVHACVMCQVSLVKWVTPLVPWLPIKTPTTVIIKTVLLRHDLRLKKQLSIKNITSQLYGSTPQLQLTITYGSLTYEKHMARTRTVYYWTVVLVSMWQIYYVWVKTVSARSIPYFPVHLQTALEWLQI